MSKFSDLKECKNLKEIYEALGEEIYEKISSILLTIWSMVPFFAIFGYLFALNAEDKLYSNKIFFRNIVEYLGIFTIIVFVILLIGKIITHKISIKDKKFVIVLLALLVWSTISAFCSNNLYTAFRGTQYRYDGLATYFIYAALFGIAIMLKDEKRRINVLRVFTMICNITCVIMVLQAYKIGNIMNVFTYEKSSVFYNANHYAYYLTMSIMGLVGLYFFDRKKIWKYVYGISFVFQFYTMILNDTFGCYIACVVGVLFAIVMVFRSQRKKGIYVIFPLIIMAILSVLSSKELLIRDGGNNVYQNFKYFFTDVKEIKEHSGDYNSEEKIDSDGDNYISSTEYSGRAGTGRMELWREALYRVKKRPILGYGPEGLTSEYCVKVGNDRPHNEFIQYAAFLGIPGLLMYLTTLLMIFFSKWKNMKKMGIAGLTATGMVMGYIISSCFGNTMFYTAPFLWIMLGITAVIDNGKEQRV